MQRLILSFALVFLSGSLFYSSSSAGQVYKWVDDKGDAHFSDSLSGVPAKYRGQVETKQYRKKTRSTVKQQSGAESGIGRSGPGRAEAPGSEAGELRRFEVPYKPYQGTARRIIIPVTFNGSVTAPMMLDTGAPEMLITPALAEKIGLFSKNDGMLFTRAGGVGGSIPAIFTIIDTIAVGGARTEFVPTTIAPIFSGPFHGLVGMDFMANYSINIDTRRHVVVFKELPPRANMPAGHDEAWWRINFYNMARMRTSWKNYLDRLKNTGGWSGNERLKNSAERQYREASKLFSRLERYASHNSVPMHWRKY